MDMFHGGLEDDVIIMSLLARDCLVCTKNRYAQKLTSATFLVRILLTYLLEEFSVDLLF
jgi:hypothetical protein